MKATMSLVLQDGALSEVVPNAHLQWTPRLLLSGLSLMIGSYASGEEHEKHFLETQGSGNWYKSEYDELRFNRSDGHLESLMFHIPEVNVQDEHDISNWTSLPPNIGSLRLLVSTDFELKPTGERWYSRNGKWLICLRHTSRFPDERLRLKVADNFDLLFADNRFFGWLLADPERFLVDSWEYPQVEPGDDELAALLVEYFDIVAEPYVERMQDQDTNVFEMLKTMNQRISEDHGAIRRRSALRRSVEELIEFFFD